MDGISEEDCHGQWNLIDSEEVLVFLKEREIQLKKVALYTPSQDRLVEKFNRVIADMLKESERFERDKKKVKAEMLIDYRSTPYCTVGKSPFELMYGRKNEE